MVAENEMAVESGRRRGFWLASHNTYTQISAELGIPGLIVFLMILHRIWKIFGAGERMRGAGMSFAPDLRRLSFALKLCALVVLCSGATLSIGYGPFVPLLCGLAVVIERLMADDGYRRLAAQQDEGQASEPELAYRNTALPRVSPSHT